MGETLFGTDRAASRRSLRAGVTGEAWVSDCERYRYSLTRKWNDDDGRWMFIMLNPSTADAEADDPTLRRIQDFAIRGGAGSLVVVNLFAFRATDPKELRGVDATGAIGEMNDVAIAGALSSVERIICAWGALHKRELPRAHAVMRLILKRPLEMLGCTVEGHPRHPLYLSNDETARTWWWWKYAAYKGCGKEGPVCPL